MRSFPGINAGAPTANPKFAVLTLTLKRPDLPGPVRPAKEAA